MQYVLIRPGTPHVSAVRRSSLMYITAISIAGIICQYYGVLCASGSYSIHYAAVYLDSVDFVSVRYINQHVTLLCRRFFQHRPLWFNSVLWPDQGRARRTPPSCQVFIDQTHYYVHLLPVFRGMEYNVNDAFLSTNCHRL